MKPTNRAAPLHGDTVPNSVLFSLIFALFLVLLSAAVAAAQSPATGSPVLGSFTGSPDVIDLANLNAHLSIPVLTKPGRGTDFSYVLSYDTSVWSKVTSGSTTWQPSLQLGLDRANGNPNRIHHVHLSYAELRFAAPSIRHVYEFHELCVSRSLGRHSSLPRRPHVLRPQTLQHGHGLFHDF